jgi:HD superfamily phosphohydrolase
MEFKDSIIKNNANPLLAARMIMGCKYENSNSLYHKFQNKLISLLNGAGFDVDTLDYIQRDSWISGVSNVNIDYHRLLFSTMIKPDKNNIPQIVFKKQALSVIENISMGRNFLFKWIYSHHQVLYEQCLLEKIVQKINLDSNNEFFEKVFSLESFFEPQYYNGKSYFLPIDDDIIHTIKQNYFIDPQIVEFFSHNYKYKAIWKTYFEFDEVFFENINDINRMSLVTKIDKGYLDKKFGKGNILCIRAKPKLKSIKPNDYFIDISERFIDASKATSIPNENLNYFLIFISKKLEGKEDQILKQIYFMQA